MRKESIVMKHIAARFAALKAGVPIIFRSITQKHLFFPFQAAAPV